MERLEVKTTDGNSFSLVSENRIETEYMTEGYDGGFLYLYAKAAEGNLTVPVANIVAITHNYSQR
jgi:hypothetical protein